MSAVKNFSHRLPNVSGKFKGGKKNTFSNMELVLFTYQSFSQGQSEKLGEEIATRLHAKNYDI